MVDIVLIVTHSSFNFNLTPPVLRYFYSLHLPEEETGSERLSKVSQATR